jgi:subtilisin family serine protease
MRIKTREGFKRRRVSLCVGSLIVLISLCTAWADDPIPGQIMIDIKHEYLPINPTPNGQGIMMTGLTSIDSINAEYGVHTFDKITDNSWSATKGFYFLKFPTTRDISEVHASYSSDEHIHLVGYTGRRKCQGVVPQDYYFSEQWGLRKMKCPDAWRYTSGVRDVIIQIIDGGTDYGHPDLVHNIWQNSQPWPYGEDADEDGHTIEWDPINNEWILDEGDLDGYDDDYNGLPDDLVGWDFRDWDGDPKSEFVLDLNPWHDHGNKTAGTAAACTDNRIGLDEATGKICDNDTNSVAGTSWFSRVMTARVGDYYGNIDDQAIQAIQYGRNKGAKIISMSWSGPVDNALLHAQIDSAYNESILLIGAAGNYVYDVPEYPAAYENVIAVAATDSNDIKESYSNYGNWLDLCAPGENKSPSWAQKWPYCYARWSGTSCSTPFVAGLAALVWSCNRNASNSEVRNALESTANYICNLPGNQGQPWCYPFNKLGHGRVNAWDAVKVFRPVPPPPGDANSDMVVGAGDVVCLLSYIFRNGPPPDPWCVGDVTDDGIIDAEDVTYLLAYIFQGGPPPQDGCD